MTNESAETERHAVDSMGTQQNTAGAPPGTPEVHPYDRGLKRGCLNVLAVVFGLLFALHILLGGWPVNYGAPVRGRVIDERTGKPVAGAVVVGEWYTQVTLGGDHRMHASETVTNARGEFLLPGMPLKIRWPLHDYHWFYDPLLSIYKPGYAVTSADNRVLSDQGRHPSRALKRVSYWDGKDLPLLPVDDIKSEAESLIRIKEVANGRDTLHPRRYPLLWSAILQGARRIPKGQFGYGYGDPTESYNYYMGNGE